MKIRLAPLAQREFREARSYYRQRSPTVASKFATAIRDRLDEIAQFPLSSQKTSVAARRRAVVSGFPFVILYEVRAHEIYVASVFHTSRAPMTLPDRMR